MNSARFRTLLAVAALFLAVGLRPAATRAQGPAPGGSLPRDGINGPLPLSAYPRPKNDNGLGIHWSTHIYGQTDDVTDYFVDEITDMGIKWVKFLNAETDGRDYDYMIDRLVANDIMPIVRIYRGCNEPLDLGSLGHMVDYYLPRGLYYYELYNEPDIRGKDGGWCDDPEPDPEYLAAIWAPAAREIQAHGGYPSLPSIFPVGKGIPGWEDSFFQRFLRAIEANGDTDVLYRSWGAVHNYFINHPPTYPRDEVNLTGRPLTAAEVARYGLSEGHVQAINRARANQREPGGYYVGDNSSLDVTGFLQFLAYHEQFVEIFGFEIPLISTEGGATVGSCEDPRYPCVDERIQMEWTLAAYEYMLDEAPDYYFANNTWLIAQKALEYYGGTVWEGNAWYHDRKGNHLPVVEALKSHPRKGQARWDQRPAGGPAQAGLPVANPTPPAARFAGQLAAYPRPPADNGRGVHYAPTLFAQSPQTVDYFVGELVAMNIKWVKLMQGDLPKVEHPYLIEQLVAHGIEPVVRVYKPYNEPYQHLSALVAAARPMGVDYFELYNEPNIAGFPGGWRDGESISVSRMLDLWIPAAAAIRDAGGYPGLPTLAPGGSYDDLRFLEAFLDGLSARRRADLLDRAWLPLHNYFLNHPFDYPYDPVNLQSLPLSAAEIEARGLSPEQVTAINAARANARQPGGFYVGSTIHADSNSFRKFEAYAKIVYDRFGFYLPIISTEGGAIAGEQQDLRYPAVTQADVTELTLRGYHAMLDSAPPYYFAFTPWLLTSGAGGHWDPAWENATWYKPDGSTLPVVEALKNDPRRQEIRRFEWGAEAAGRPLAMGAAPGPSPLAAPPPAPPAGPSAPAPEVPQVDALSAEIVPAGGSGPAWEVTLARWRTAAGAYPRLYLDVVDAGGRRLDGQQVRISWSGGWSLLVTGGLSGHSASMPLAVPTDVYLITIAGGSGQSVRARGAAGHDLHVTFRRAGN